MRMLVEQYLSKRRYTFFCEDGTTLLSKNKPKRHKCKVSFNGSSAKAIRKCAGRPHMKMYDGQIVLWRSDGSRLFTDISKTDLDHPKIVVTERV